MSEAGLSSPAALAEPQGYVGMGVRGQPQDAVLMSNRQVPSTVDVGWGEGMWL